MAKWNLHAAIEVADYSLVCRLLDEGVNVNTENYCGQTALHVAVIVNNVELVDTLIDKGADINAKDRYDETPLSYAIRLIRNAYLIMRRATIIDDAVIICLVNRGALLNMPYKCGCTPLHAAVMLNSSSLVEKVLQRGFPIDLKDSNGMTPLFLAFKLTMKRSPRLINILLDHGADIEAADKAGCSPLQAAVRDGSTSAVQFILAKGANVNSRSNSGDTALHDAIQIAENVDKIVILLSFGASLEAENSGGMIPLQIMFESFEDMWDNRTKCRNHILKMHAAGFTVSQTAVDRVRNIQEGVDHNQLEEEYHQELRVINNTTVGGNDLGIVLRNYRRPHYMANKELVNKIQELMNSPQFCQTFPNYALILYCTFSKSRKVYNLFHLATRSLINLLSPNQVLPREIILQILELLDDSTQRQLVKSGLCCSPPGLAPELTQDLLNSIQRFSSGHYLSDIELQRLLRSMEEWNDYGEEWNDYGDNYPLLLI